MLKPQDVMLALELCLLKDKLTYAQLAENLCMSASAVHAGAERLAEAGLLDRQAMRIKRKPFVRFLEHGVPFVYPVREMEVTRGIPTSWAAPVLRSDFAGSSELPPVWADARGEVKGCRVVPLYKSVPKVIKKNAKLYPVLALVDALRMGRAREKSIARDLLEKYLLSDESIAPN